MIPWSTVKKLDSFFKSTEKWMEIFCNNALCPRLKVPFLIKIWRLSVRSSAVVINFSHFHLLLQNLFLLNFTQSIFGWWGFKFVQIYSCIFFQGEKIVKYWNKWLTFKNLLLWNHCLNFYQTGAKQRFQFVQWRATLFSN